MNYLPIVLVIAIISVFAVLIILFFIPVEGQEKKKKKKKTGEEIDFEKRANSLQEEAERHERQIKSLQGEVSRLKQLEKDQEKLLADEREKAAKLDEKLKQEREWHKKELETFEHKVQGVKQVKDELLKLQEQLSHEHSLTLKFEQEAKELRTENSSINDKRRLLESELDQWRGRAENYAKEVTQLKKDIVELSKKKEDAAWVAKSDFDQIKHLLKNREQELERYKRNPSPSSQLNNEKE